MANHEHAQERCPNCGRNEIEADRRYGNKLKNRELIRQTFRSPIFWIGFALVVLPVWIPQLGAWHYGLEALGFVLVVILAVRVNRAVFGPAATTQFPRVRYTCRQCGYQWTSEESRATVADVTDEREACADLALLETAKEEQQPGAKEITTPSVPQNWWNRKSGWGRPERRLAIAVIAALAAAIATLFLPISGFLELDGDICPGYGQGDIGMYFARFIPLTLIAAVFGFVTVMTWPQLFGKSGKISSNVGCGIAAIAVGGVVWMLICWLLALIVPGCEFRYY